jgi:hypothetical protein
MSKIITKSLDLSFSPYEKPIESTRSGAIFRFHPYPTKINFRSIMPFVLAHTKPNDVVYDGFAGSFSTAFGAAACEIHDAKLIQNLGISSLVKIPWGKRKIISSDIGQLPTFIGKTLTTKINFEEFEKCFNNIISKIEHDWNWMYQTEDPNSNNGIIRYTIYSDLIQCKNCKNKSTYYELFVDEKEGKFMDESICKKCNEKIMSNNLIKVTENIYDDILGKKIIQTKRIPVKIYGSTKTSRWERKPTTKDIKQLKKIQKIKLRFKQKPIKLLSGKEKWGELHRSGYHKGITHLHHFYTKRNFLCLSILYNAVKYFPKDFKDHYLLLLSSYNVSNSSIMARFVFKEKNTKPVITSNQPGTLYVSSCPVEKNPFLGIKKKFRDLKEAKKEISQWNSEIIVNNSSAQDSHLKDNSVDYIFTDPPFGENIQYSEVNFLSEAWLGKKTKNLNETIISKYQKKDLQKYENLLTSAFQENFRILKPGKFMTVIFHNTKKEVWNSLRNAISSSGFEIMKSSILDKDQTSFKQTTTKGAVKKDIILLTQKPIQVSKKKVKPVDMKKFLLRVLSDKKYNNQERTFDYLFSRYIGQCFKSNVDIKNNSFEFKKMLSQLAKINNNSWFLKTHPN